MMIIREAKKSATRRIIHCGARTLHLHNATNTIPLRGLRTWAGREISSWQTLLQIKIERDWEPNNEVPVAVLNPVRASQ